MFYLIILIVAFIGSILTLIISDKYIPEYKVTLYTEDNSLITCKSYTYKVVIVFSPAMSLTIKRSSLNDVIKSLTNFIDNGVFSYNEFSMLMTISKGLKKCQY